MIDFHFLPLSLTFSINISFPPAKSHYIPVNKKPRRTISIYHKADKEVLQKEFKMVKDTYLQIATGRRPNVNWIYFTNALQDVIENMYQKDQGNKT